MTSDTQLKTFILYCQAVETAYTEWKNYWLNFYMNNDNKSKDLYDENFNVDSWLEKQKNNPAWKGIWR